jgi:hypothetical protein
MGGQINGLIEQRQLRLAIIDILAQPLQGDAREEFIARQREILNRDLPAPSRHHMRLYLKAVD